MPELPEVETTRRGIAPRVTGQTVRRVVVREPRLRWPVPRALARALPGNRIVAVRRRAKYLLLLSEPGTVILHLGMSGNLRVVPAHASPHKHDHLDIELEDGSCLRLGDPRRFGSVHWTGDNPESHPLLCGLGVEPLGQALDGEYLYHNAHRRSLAVKQYLMNSHIVAGLGNIYANECLFAAGIHPLRSAGRISRERYATLASAIKQVITAAIEAGGTTLRDFVNAEGRPGYFRLDLRVYGRAGHPCPLCGGAIRQIVQGRRSTFYCVHCQH